MIQLQRNEEEKFKLIKEIIEVSSSENTCVRLHHRPFLSKSRPFIDWYLVLRVNENAAVDVIRKQYHKLALLLHPDKNKHPKAETAFKLVSEAYRCLSDNARRTAFHSERENFSCIACNIIPSINWNPQSHTNVKKIQRPYHKKLRFNGIIGRMKDLQTKLKEEATIIEKCLISRRESVNTCATRTELPVFNPLDYQSKGYPRHRTIDTKKLENLRGGFMIGNRCIHNPMNSESPIFQYKPKKEPYMSGL